jgi:hypothetical protein
MDTLKLSLHDYKSVQELSDEELKKMISEIIDIEEVPSALNELYERDAELSISLGKNILEHSLGDEYLQAAVVEFIFNHNKQYIVDFIECKIATMNYYVYGCILDCLSVESMQPFGKSLSNHFLKTIVNKYNVYDEDKKNKINDKYIWFLDSYAKMI